MERRKNGLSKRERRLVFRFIIALIFVVVLALGRKTETNTAGDGPITLTDITGDTQTATSQDSGTVITDNDSGSSESAGNGSGVIHTYQGTFEIPAYEGEPFTEINGNVPFFTDDDLTTDSYETYGELDELGRCTAAMACVGKDIMPTEGRESIGNIKPTGWHQNKYDVGEDVDSPWIYNRCHLIAFQLAGENDNPKNLITGTRAFNLKMLIYENMVADYIKNTNNHVLYRVTPIFDGNDLLAKGVLMEGESVEDDGAGITFCVFCHNRQSGVVLDYATGENWKEQ